MGPNEPMYVDMDVDVDVDVDVDAGAGQRLLDTTAPSIVPWKPTYPECCQMQWS
jgi:hypothetical protein